MADIERDAEVERISNEYCKRDTIRYLIYVYGLYKDSLDGSAVVRLILRDYCHCIIDYSGKGIKVFYKDELVYDEEKEGQLYVNEYRQVHRKI